MGLGNAEDVKIVKLSSSNSNRHLLNVTGDYSLFEGHIEVTIKNLYLDASTNTTGGKDNAAVQSIRASKVKCYDLIIKKASGYSAYAFYVNGNDSSNRGAYLYTENCSVIGVSQAYSVVTPKSPCTFWFQNLTYGSTEATQSFKATSPYQTDSYLPYDNWDWKNV